MATHSFEQLCCGNRLFLFQPISQPSRSDTIAIPALPSNARASAVTRSFNASGGRTAAAAARGGVGLGAGAGTLRCAAADAETWVIDVSANASPKPLPTDVMTPLTPRNFRSIPINCLTPAEPLLCRPAPENRILE